MGTYSTNMRERHPRLKKAQEDRSPSSRSGRKSGKGRTVNVGRKSRRRKLDELHTLK